MKPINLALAALLVIAAPAFAQHEHEGGHPPPPAHGPQEYHGAPHPEDHRNYVDKPGYPDAPHVDDGRVWVGHDEGRDDRHFHVDHPWEHGHFNGGFGPEHHWRIEGDALPAASGSTAGIGASRRGK